VLSGTFKECTEDGHVVRRRDLLSQFQAPLDVGGPTSSAARFTTVPEVCAIIRGQLERSGLASFQYEKLPDSSSFRELGEAIGCALPETDPAVQQFVDDGFILNLRSQCGHTQDIQRQPFSTAPIALHSESSGASVERQPRVILFLCIQPGGPKTFAQTIVVPMSEVTSRLAPAHLGILQKTRYKRCEHGPMIARRERHGITFSFRDFSGDSLEWVSEAQGATEDEVNSSIRALLMEMYDPAIAKGIQWRRGLVIAIDNQRFFHGRAAGSAEPDTQMRHLLRMRLASAAAPNA